MITEKKTSLDKTNNFKVQKSAIGNENCSEWEDKVSVQQTGGLRGFNSPSNTKN